MNFLDVARQNFDALLFLARSKLNFGVIESLANFFLRLVIQVFQFLQEIELFSDSLSLPLLHQVLWLCGTCLHARVTYLRSARCRGKVVSLQLTVAHSLQLNFKLFVLLLFRHCSALAFLLSLQQTPFVGLPHKRVLIHQLVQEVSVLRFDVISAVLQYQLCLAVLRGLSPNLVLNFLR